MEQMRLTSVDLSEEQKWQEFVDNYDSKAHPNSRMPDGCYTCKVGKRWSEADNIKLIEMVQPGVTLEDMARELNRSFLGISGRLQLMGIITLPSPGHYYGMVWSDRVRIATLQYRYKQTNKICFDVVSFMEENCERLGWKRTDHVFFPPEEMRRTPVKVGSSTNLGTNELSQREGSDSKKSVKQRSKLQESEPNVKEGLLSTSAKPILSIKRMAHLIVDILVRNDGKSQKKTCLWCWGK